MPDPIIPIDDNEDGDLIPKDQLPTDPAVLGQDPIPPDPVPPVVPITDPPVAPVDVPPVVVPPVEKLDDLSQPKPVDGETPREKALRLEVQRLRTVNRKEQVKELTEVPAASAKDDYQALRDQGYTDEDIAKMESAVDIIASKKGYIRADRSYATTVQDTVDLFTEAHPEYKPSNDTDDLRWNRFNAYLKDGTYNLSGKTPKQLTAIFEKVDADVKRELGEIVTTVSPAARAAAVHKVEVVSHSSGTRNTPTEKPSIDLEKPIGGIKFKGFDKDDFS